MDAQTVADLLGVSTRQLNNYINCKGLPSQGSGRSRTYVWREVLEWFVDYRSQMEMGGGSGGSEGDDFDDDSSDIGGAGKKEDIRAANLRKTRAEADLKQLALSKLRGEVIVIADAKVRIDRMLGNLRTQLLAIAPKLANLPESEVREEIVALCRELSTGAVVDHAEDETAEAIEEMAAAADVEYTDADVSRIVLEFLEAHAALQP